VEYCDTRVYLSDTTVEYCETTLELFDTTVEEVTPQ
jgi:hypothetical protein